MPTIEKYQEVAPILSSSKTAQEIETLFAAMPPNPPAPSEPTITDAKKTALLQALTTKPSISESISYADGYAGLASKIGLSVSQVEALCKEASQMHSIYLQSL